jgi:hypothetical protein
MTIKGRIDRRHTAFCPVCGQERDETRPCVCGNERTWAQHLNACIARMDATGITNAILAGVAGAQAEDWPKEQAI